MHAPGTYYTSPLRLIVGHEQEHLCGLLLIEIIGKYTPDQKFTCSYHVGVTNLPFWGLLSMKKHPKHVTFYICQLFILITNQFVYVGKLSCTCYTVSPLQAS